MNSSHDHQRKFIVNGGFLWVFGVGASVGSGSKNFIEIFGAVGSSALGGGATENLKIGVSPRGSVSFADPSFVTSLVAKLYVVTVTELSELSFYDSMSGSRLCNLGSKTLGSPNEAKSQD